MISIEKIIKILGAEEATLVDCVGNDILEKVAKENEAKIKEKLNSLGVQEDISEIEIFNVLLEKAEQDDKKLLQEYPDLLKLSHEIANLGTGFFIKENKAKEFLLNIPPENVVKFLGYADIEETLKNEDFFEVFSAMRFVEDDEWMNKLFFKQFETLTIEDFEERPIQTIKLSDKWQKIAQQFLKKKYHNISHLKELGVIFMLPATLGVAGEGLRTLSLLLHYHHEIDFYSRLFRNFSQTSDFAERMISSLRGDVLDQKLEAGQWMIVQQYLAKKDETDWRLFQPHINPEALHWKKAEDGISSVLSFWKDLECVGSEAYSFNLVDVVMSLVRKRDGTKYLYHQKEALWNKIFSELIGEEKMEELIIDNFEKGFIKLT
ncbi:hypothetical protein ACFLZC_00710 [Patescibacteria group bacterium]